MPRMSSVAFTICWRVYSRASAVARRRRSSVVCEVEVRLFFVGNSGRVLETIAVSDHFDGRKVKVLGFCIEYLVHFHSLGEVVSVL